MANELRTIRQVIEEHQGMRELIELMADQLNDREAIMALEREHSEWIPWRTEALGEKKARLIKTLGPLEQGLKNPL